MIKCVEKQLVVLIESIWNHLFWTLQTLKMKCTTQGQKYHSVQCKPTILQKHTNMFICLISFSLTDCATSDVSQISAKLLQILCVYYGLCRVAKLNLSRPANANTNPLTQERQYRSGLIRFVSRKEHSSGSWYSNNNRNKWNGVPFL